jgi:hypothetical protein
MPVPEHLFKAQLFGRKSKAERVRIRESPLQVQNIKPLFNLLGTRQAAARLYQLSRNALYEHTGRYHVFCCFFSA